MLFDWPVEDRSLLLTDHVALEDVLSRRRPDLLRAVQGRGLDGLSDATREEIRRALVDEICELPREGTDHRRALALVDLLRTI